MNHRLIVGLICLLFVGLLLPGLDCADRKEMMSVCSNRTGIASADIADYHTRNDDCAIDCITKLGSVVTVWQPENQPCHGEPGYRCVLGLCLEPGQRASETEPLWQTEIHIYQAQVKDMDIVPGTGGSDAFVMVEVERDGGVLHEDGEFICHTYVIQDNNRPNWKDYKCKPLPIRLDTRLKFSIIDSDKPSNNHDELGYTIQTVEDLINQGRKRLRLMNTFGKMQSDNYYLELEVKGQKYEYS